MGKCVPMYMGIVVIS